MSKIQSTLVKKYPSLTKKQKNKNKNKQKKQNKKTPQKKKNSQPNILVTMGVCSLYTNISNNKDLEVVITTLKQKYIP